VYQQQTLFVREGAKHAKAIRINWFSPEQYRGMYSTPYLA
jgi:hypothetical protein